MAAVIPPPGLGDFGGPSPEWGVVDGSGGGAVSTGRDGALRASRPPPPRAGVPAGATKTAAATAANSGSGESGGSGCGDREAAATAPACGGQRHPAEATPASRAAAVGTRSVRTRRMAIVLRWATRRHPNASVPLQLPTRFPP